MPPVGRFGASATVILLFAVSRVLCLWPMPQSLQMGTTPLVLAPNFKVVSIPHSPADLEVAIARTNSFIKNDKLERLVVGRSSADASKAQHARQLGSLVLSLSRGAATRSIATEAIAPLGSRSEEYTLRIPADGSSATLSANSTLGLFRGLTTFEQLWYQLDDRTTYTMQAPISIVDSPAFVSEFHSDAGTGFDGKILSPIAVSCSIPREICTWRLPRPDDASLVCLSFPVSDIKRTLDAMSWAKVDFLYLARFHRLTLDLQINQFHWHAVDSQSFPLQIPGFEEISSQGAYSPSMVYTPKDIQDIVTYAGEASSLHSLTLRF